jgi:hypothetical protein
MKIFFSLPFTVNFDETGKFKLDRRKFYGDIISFLQQSHEVYSAPTNENWGEIKLATVEFTKYDIESIEQCDCMIVVCSERLSRDIYLEIGIALGLNKPVYMIIPEQTPVTYMILGSVLLGKLEIFRYQEESEALSIVKQIAL